MPSTMQPASAGDVKRMILAFSKGKMGKDGQDGRDGTDGQDGYTPVPGVDYPTDAQIDAKIAAALAERNQLEPLVAESVTWLNENGDPTKVYIVPNADGQGGKVYAYAETEAVLEPDNVLAENPLLGDKDINVGVVKGVRLSSSTGNETTNSGALSTGFIPCDDDDILTVTGWRGINGTSMYIIAYDVNKARLANVTIGVRGTTDFRISPATKWATVDDGTDTFVTNPLTSVMSTETVTITGIGYIRLCADVNVADTMEVYVNKSSTVDTVAAWYAFADFVPTADARIEELDRRLSVVESGALGAVDMRTWDKPVYDTTPVVLIGDDTDPTKAKPAVGDRNTVQAIYDAYDALMAAHPLYITKTPYKDKTADGQALYRYDFKAPKPHEYSGGGNPVIVKPKIILISGIHYEWVGIWSLFHALEEIVTNPALRDIRRNVHLIVVPVCNPYCLSGPYSATNGRKNANGVEIHRNFAVDHAVIDPTSNNYGGAEPLSEVETRHIDSILAANPEAVAFVSCHNFDGRDTSKPFGTSGGGSDYGTTFMWASTATNYLYNLGGRFGVKMSEAWEDKYGDAWRDQIDAIIAARKTAGLTHQPEGDYTVGTAGKSTTPGTEAKHCMLYGIQGMTFEVAGNMMALDSENADSITITRGAEVYANLIATLLGAFDPRDKKEYALMTTGETAIV